MAFSSLFVLLGAIVWWGGEGVVNSESSVGCLFSNQVCDDNEWCYDDNIFGKCLPSEGLLEASNYYQYNLEKDMLKKLEYEMMRLFEKGYHWSHGYTQCILQNLLYSYRYGFDYNPSLCKEVADIDKNVDFLQDDSQNLAVIHFNPSYFNKHSDYADELFLPPMHHSDADSPHFYGSAQKLPPDMSIIDQNVKLKRKQNPGKSGMISKEEVQKFISLLNSQAGNEMDVEASLFNQNEPNIFQDYHDIQDGFDNDDNMPSNQDEDLFSDDFENSNYINSQEIRNFRGENSDSLFDMDDKDNNLFDDVSVQDGAFKRLHRYDVKKPGPNFMTNLDDFDSKEAVVNEQLHQVSLFKSLEEALQEKQNLSASEAQKFTAEGMMLNSPLDEKHNNEKPDSQDKLIQKDNKKSIDYLPPFNKETIQMQQEEAHLDNHPVENYKKQTMAEVPNETNKPTNYDVVDTSYAYITVDKGFNSRKEGAEFVETLEELLGLPPRIFSNIRVEGDQVTFKVNPDENGLNASLVASKAEAMRNEVQQATGRAIISAGIGNQVKVSVLSLESDKKLFIVTFIVCGCIAGVLIAVAVVYIVRHHARSREKLQNLSHPDTEPSHDYQDLCRQRMANKSNEKPESIPSGQRISSLSKESEASVRSPSSRSSTSSWSEEPVVSNMDISTGHMVLSYMEDHLKNKDRLDQEWVALCAYEAEPCSVEAATEESNAKKNRYPDIIPYDHSRVVLNDDTNIAKSDYINASTITDHDPRNPAYIATQGPLPHTAADFWQMVWEQGSVVIVTLTRLVENGIAMSHRYWPEEGSELYHIYEVHLVSEHIWCDDYLVRSFYLKNLKTGETRTVTQFHFLSWTDNSVPASVKALLDFRRKVNKSYRGRSCPIVVHCSDGSGRTGTYCLIDMVLNRMAKGAKEIDIAATLEHIRDQRPIMVKTKGQFEFALTAVAEEVHAILKALPQ